MDTMNEREQLDIIFRTATGEDIAVSAFAGSNHSTRVPVRDIARTALSLDAFRVLIRHNHPSGNVTPSRADLVATREIASALRLIGVTVDDHQITAGDRCFSFRAAGLILTRRLCFIAASMKLANSGCGAKGLDFNSG